jgi:hypothetical protein
VCVGNKTKRGSKKDAKDLASLGQRELILRVHTFLQRYRCRNYKNKDENNKCLVTPSYLRQPDLDMLARGLDRTLVQQIFHSMVTKFVADPNVYGLVWENGFTCEDIVDDIQFELDIQAIVGMHTSTAIQDGHKRFPGNPKFTHVPCTLICCPDTPENRMLAAAWGNIQNQINMVTKAMTAWDYLTQLRQKFLDLEERKASGVSSKLLKAAQGVIIKDYSSAWNIPSPSVHQYWGIAAREQILWDLISKIFQGQVVQNSVQKFKVPKSVTHFTMMAKIPVADLARWLQCVVNGDPVCNSTQNFMAACKRFKKSQAVLHCVLAYVNVRYAPATGKVKHIQALYDMLPVLLKNNWFTCQVNICADTIKPGYTLPSSVKETIDHAVAYNKSSKEVYMYIYIYVCMVYVYGYMIT